MLGIQNSRGAYSVWWGLVSGLLTALLWVLSLPPFEFPEGAYVAFVPVLLWLYTRLSGWKLSLAVGFGTAWLSWFFILIWLRHVTLLGTFALAGVLAAIVTPGSSLVRWVLPRFGAQLRFRFAGLFSGDCRCVGVA